MGRNRWHSRYLILTPLPVPELASHKRPRRSVLPIILFHQHFLFRYLFLLIWKSSKMEGTDPVERKWTCVTVSNLIYTIHRVDAALTAYRRDSDRSAHRFKRSRRNNSVPS
ncbi:hypothetical protein BGW80DRAFT_1403300 [Lactifluus volemus]|nr:hypothetical protein BGW80DRAFT_1403300 [Lactifluus volemus]